jgi:hypothetical protein
MLAPDLQQLLRITDDVSTVRLLLLLLAPPPPLTRHLEPQQLLRHLGRLLCRTHHLPGGSPLRQSSRRSRRSGGLQGRHRRHLVSHRLERRHLLGAAAAAAAGGCGGCAALLLLPMLLDAPLQLELVVV